MKVLFLTYHFAPYNHIGAIRCVKTAKYLTQMGDEVKVLAAAGQPFAASLDLEIDAKDVRHIPCPHLDRISYSVAAGSGLLQWSVDKKRRQGSHRAILRYLYNGYKTLTWYPD